MKITLRPSDFACTLAECPAGHFLYEDMLGFKSEYGQDAFCDSGEFFWGGTKTEEERLKLKVIPIDYEIESD